MEPRVIARHWDARAEVGNPYSPIPSAPSSRQLQHSLQFIGLLDSSMSDATQPRFGFVNFAETWNGRLAMLGFVIGLATELLTGQGILSQIGLG